MKKAKGIYIIVAAMFLAAVALIVLFFINSEKDTPVNSAIYDSSAEEYLLMNTLEKAPSAQNFIFLTEDKDCSFVYGNAQLKKIAKEITDSFFDGVIVKSTLLSSVKTKELTDTEKDKLGKVCEYFSSKDKKPFAYCTAFLSEEGIKTLASFSAGVVIDLEGVDENKSVQLTQKLTALRKALKGKAIVLTGADNDLYKTVDKKLFDCLLVKFNTPSDAEKYKTLQIEFFNSGATVSPLTDFSVWGSEKKGMELLKAHYSIKDCTDIEMRAFTSYTDAKENTDNCYSAVKAYITRGIAPLLAFRELSIPETEDDIKTTESVYRLPLSSSYLFPIYVNGQPAGTLPKGKGQLTLNLVRGKNSFTLEQSGKSLDFSVEYEFKDDLIKSVVPTDSISVSAGEEITVMVIAYSEAEVYVKLGAIKYPAVKQDEATGYTAFYAKIKMPTDINELSSLERINVIASLGEKTQQADGAEINAVMLEHTLPSAPSQLNSTSFAINNFTPTYSSVQQDIAPSISAAISKATTNTYNTPYTGNQTAVVTAEYADVMPSGGNTDFVPYYTALAKGTKDFVIGESQYYDSAENEWYYYYDLACGLKVNRDSVTLEPSQTMPENVLKVNSVYASDGELTIRLGNIWKVPYTMELMGQSYYSNNSYPYYVSSFTASAINLTFQYTTVAAGEIDCSQSDVVASASWSLSAENKTATLSLPLRQPGVFYGFNLTYEGDEAVITIRNKPKGLAGSVVVLDPGHGADDCGAMGLSGAVKESDINILVAYEVKKNLEQQGVTVYMTRYGDDDINLEGRKIFTRSVKPDMFVSIHSDASSNPESMGTSAFYYKAFSMPLASNIHNEVVSVYKNYIYAGRQDVYGNISRGVKYYPFSVTRIDECPSVLIELGFMTNQNECYLLTIPQNQQVLGQAIAKGICDTLIQ